MAVPKIQIGFLMATVLGMLLYLLLFRPYQSYLSIILSVINEVLLLSMIIICSRFTNPNITPNSSKVIGRVLMAILIITIVINWTGIIIYGTITLIKNQIKKKKKVSEKKLEKSLKHDTSVTNSRLTKDKSIKTITLSRSRLKSRP